MENTNKCGMFENIEIPSNIERIYIDVGLAADAPHSLEWLSSDPNCFVFGFEPVKENCERVLEKIKERGYEDRYKLYECAVDNVVGQQVKDFYVTCNSEVDRDHGQSSLFKLKDELKHSEGTKYWVEKVVPTVCINLADFLIKIDWERFKNISCLKTDTQGNDMNILNSIESFFDRIPLIFCESHVHGQYQKDDDNPNIVYNYMTSKGYQLVNCSIDNADHYYQRV
jgi:FkbM family methyltransferase